MATPPTLLDPAMIPVWCAVSSYLDRYGLDARGEVTVPRDLPRHVRLVLNTLIDDRQAVRRKLDLARLEVGLRDRGLTLEQVLADAGCAPQGRKESRDARRHRQQERDEALATAARRRIGADPWIARWVTAARTDVPDAPAAHRAVDELRAVLDLADDLRERSRGEVASLALGWAHRLDAGSRERRLVGKALAARSGRSTGDWDDADLWEAVGLPSDLVSAPVLTWALPLRGEGGTPGAVAAATAAAMPAPLTVLTLRDLVVDVPPGTVVLCVENPRLLEAAAQRRLPAPVVCTSGNPRRAVVLLVRALVAAGAEVRHHGDFDPAGLEITGRLRALGATPWRMTAGDYAAALDAARVDGVDLRRVAAPPPATPWDPSLADLWWRHRRAVDEERVMDALLEDHAAVEQPY